MKLYNVPRTTNGTLVRILDDIEIKTDFWTIKKGSIITFYHIDTMYAHCRKEGVMIHIPVTFNVEIVRCKYVHREGESCTLNNNCKYPDCELVNK